MFKVGDKVLVEGEISRTGRGGHVINFSEKRGHQFVGLNRIRPWTENPPEPVREVYRTENGCYKVMSDGEVLWFNRALDRWETPIDTYVKSVLAEYVRQTEGGKP